MEHENVDENAKYLLACENIKRIVKVIKAIKMKYYTNFSRISDTDRKIYEQLEANLEQISEENNLGKLKSALMEEVSAKYDKKDIKNEPSDPNSVDNKLLACYGAIDVQQKALSCGKIKQAIKCQKILEQYLEEIDKRSYKEVINYKREKFSELIREDVEKRNDTWMNDMKAFYNIKDVTERSEAKQKIEEAKIKLFNKQTQSSVLTEMRSGDSEELQIG